MNYLCSHPMSHLIPIANGEVLARERLGVHVPALNIDSDFLIKASFTKIFQSAFSIETSYHGLKNYPPIFELN